MEKEVGENSEFEEIDLREYINVLIKRKKIILGIFIISILISIFISYFILEPIYQTKATIKLSTGEYFVNNAKTDEFNKIANNSGDYSNPEIVKEILTSSEYLKQIDKRLNQKYNLSKSNDKLQVKNNDKLIYITYSSNNPKKTKLVVDELIKLFETDSYKKFKKEKIESKNYLDDVNASIKDLNKQIKYIEAKVDSLSSSKKLSVADKIVLSGKIQDMKEFKLSLMDKKYLLQKSLNSMEPLKVINEPVVPKRSIKPNKKLNIAIATILGLLVGIFSAVVLEFLEKN